MIEMEGIELWVLLDLVKEFREKGDTLGKSAEEVIDEKAELKSKASVYKEVAERLEKVLRKLSVVDES
jgi:hypothetical protein